MILQHRLGSWRVRGPIILNNLIVLVLPVIQADIRAYTYIGYMLPPSSLTCISLRPYMVINWQLACFDCGNGNLPLH